MNPVEKHARDWEAAAIEKCRNDPAVIAARLCPVCMCSPPCLCERAKTVKAMRAYYEANRRTIFRAEPSAKGSWGVPIDVLMEKLAKIATAAYVAEIKHLKGTTSDG